MTSSESERGRSPFRSSSFTLLLSGQCISQFGSYVSWVAVLWLLTDLSDSPFLASMVLALFFAPTLIMLLPSGLLVDKKGPFRPAIFSELGNAITMALLAAALYFDYGNILVLSVYAVASGIFSALLNPAVAAIFPASVHESQLVAANSYRQILVQSAGLLGPVAGGFIIARWSITAAIAIDSLTFATSALIFASLSRRRGAMPNPLPEYLEGTTRQSTRDMLSGALQFILKGRGMLITIVLIALANMMNTAETAIVPRLARFDLGMTAEQFGLLGAFAAGGAIVGGIVVERSSYKIEMPARAICGGVVAYGMAIMIMGAAQVPTVLYAAYLLFGFAFMVAEILTSSLWQQMIPAELRGRVFSLIGLISMSATPTGYLVSGAAAEILGLRSALLCGGLVIIACGVLAYGVREVRSFRFATSSDTVFTAD